MDTFGMMGAMGMVFGIIGFAFALDALKKVRALENKLEKQGNFTAND